MKEFFKKNMKYTPENITELGKNEIFVFGSNEAGVHGAGAARLAWQKFGAKMGVGYGFTGNCYALPTKDERIETMSIEDIKSYVDAFIEEAKHCKHLKFLVTKIGCGLAGHTPETIAPLFKGAPNNCILPKEFVDILSRKS